MTDKTPRIAKNRRKSTSPGTRKTGKLFFFLSSSSSFFFVFFVFFVYENSASMQGTQIAIANISVHLN